MKRKKLLILLILLTYSLFAVKKPDQITFITEDKRIFPVLMNSGSQVLSKDGGLFVDISHLISKEIKVPIKITRYPLNRALVILKAGKADGFLTLSYKPEREESVVYPKINDKVNEKLRIYYSQYCFYARLDSKVFWDKKSKNLINNHKPIGAQLGYSVNHTVKMLGYDIEEVNEVRENFIKLLNQRIDVLVAHENTGDGYVYKYPSLFKKILPPVSKKAYYIVFSHQFYYKYPQLCQQIWEISSSLVQTDQYQSAKKNYLKSANIELFP
ncbi:MAG: transporter substrate-binding domain-containing protein [Spirochaetes bacterium]|nr:transporter substrate-binding domain-containing protein [Spirochaetota bacterium]